MAGAPVKIQGHELSMEDGIVACAAHGRTCPLLTYTLTPLQRVLMAGAPDETTRAKLAYTALIENQVRAAMKAKGHVLPPEWTLNLSFGDPSQQHVEN